MNAPVGPAEPVLAGSEPPPRNVRWSLRRLDDRQNPLPSIIAAAYEQPIVRQTTPVGAFHLVADPEGIKRVMLDNVANYPKTPLERRFFSNVFGDGLISSEGEVWHSHRRTMAPSFSPASVMSYVAAMAEEASATQAAWDLACPDQPVDIARDMTELMLRIIARVMFSADGAALSAQMERAVAGAMETLRPSLADFMPVVGPLRSRALKRKVGVVFADVDAAMQRMIAEREHAGGGDDLLARLIMARDSDGGRGMTAQEVRDEMLTIFVAGHETTAVAMAWIWYLLSQHPAVETRLRAELAAVLGGRPPTAEDLPQLAYTRMVAEEAMRLYPPAPGTSARVALAADEVCGVRIPKGGYVVVAPWVTHRHQRLWDEPLRFDPERFSKAASEARPRFAYIPFGAGPRVCIGASLAMTEILVALAVLAQRHRLSLAPGHRVEFVHRVMLRPRGGLPMTITRR